MSDTSLVFNLVSRDRASATLDKIKEKFTQVRGTVAKVAATSMAIPGMAAVAAGGAALALSFAAAGIAAKAFTMAAGPQMAQVTAAWDLYSAAQDAAAKGGEEAAAAQKAYTDALAQMSPATRTTAKAFIGLKSDFSKWSDSLSGSTMPVFTKGIEILRNLLPMLTPFVKSAAAAFSGFLDDVGKGVNSAGFKGFAADLAHLSGPTLTALLTSLKNVGVGLGGMLAAFLPVSTGMGTGMTDLTAKFAAWGQGLDDSEGFANFLDMAATGGDTLGTLGGAAVNLLSAVSPLIGTTAMFANGLAKVINAVPTPVLTTLAAVLLAVKIVMLANAAAAVVVAAKNRIMAMSQTPVILGWLRMQAVGVAAMVRIAATSTLTAATTGAAWVGSALVSIGTWIAAVVRAAVTSAAQFLLMAGRAVAWAVVMAAQWIIAMGPIGWVIALVVGLVALIVLNWDRIKNFTSKTWAAIWGSIKNFGQMILGYIKSIPLVSYFVQHWDRIKSGTVSRVLGLVSYVRGMPGRIKSALGNMGSLLYNSGRSVVTGLWNGIKGMGGWLRDQVISFAKNSVTGSIADALGIGSPAKVLADKVGHWIPPGIAMGALDNRGVIDKAMASLVTAPSPSTTTGVGRQMAPAMASPLYGPGDGGGVQIVRFEFTGADREFLTFFKKITRTDRG